MSPPFKLLADAVENHCKVNYNGNMMMTVYDNQAVQSSDNGYVSNYYSSCRRQEHPNYRDKGIMPLRNQYSHPVCESPLEDFDAQLYYSEHNVSTMLSLSDDQYRLPYMLDTIESDYSKMEFHGHSMSPTASNKESSINTSLGSNWQRDWKEKPVKQWTPPDVVAWIFSVIERRGDIEVDDVRIHEFHIDGVALNSLSLRDFLNRDSLYGEVLYNELQNQQAQESVERHTLSFGREYIDLKPNLPSFSDIRQGGPVFSPLEEPILTDLTPMPKGTSHRLSDTESENSDMYLLDKKDDIQHERNMIKKKRGRPVGNRSKRKPEKKCGRLWEFIRDLLLKPEYCPSLICWENYDEGVFRFVRSDKVAELWGTIKENPKMTYEKLSRAMRYYYKSKVLLPVLGRRLVYKFGPTAKGWQTSNPNFKQNTMN